MASIGDIELAAQCAEGNHFAQKLLYEQHAGYMMIVCSRYIPQREDAQEVLMDAFYNCYKYIGSFTPAGEGSLKAWLKKIVVNQCLMHLRKKKMAFADAEMAEHIAVQDEVLERLSAKEIVGLVQQLPAGYRTVFNLYLFEGKSHKEISELLNISESTSKSQLHKARAQLQQQILNNQKH